MRRLSAVLLGLPLTFWAAGASATVLQVPSESHPDIKAAVVAAYPGDTIMVGAGSWCGAVIDKPLTLVGKGGAVIVGSKPMVDGGPAVTCDAQTITSQGKTFQIGFFLTGGASGTTIRGFTFDGRDIETDVRSLAIAIYANSTSAAKVNDVTVEHNTVLGTFQAITNRGGDGWVVRHNDLRGLTTHRLAANIGIGGFGIVLMAPVSGGPRPTAASVTHNRFEATVPMQLSNGNKFAAVFVGGADGAEVEHNRFAIVPSANPALAGRGTGVHVTRGGTAVQPVPSTNSRVRLNDGRDAEFVLVVDEPTSVMSSLVRFDSGEFRGNFGRVDLPGASEDRTVTNRRDVRKHDDQRQDPL